MMAQEQGVSLSPLFAWTGALQGFLPTRQLTAVSHWRRVWGPDWVSCPVPGEEQALLCLSQQPGLGLPLGVPEALCVPFT